MSKQIVHYYGDELLPIDIKEETEHLVICLHHDMIVYDNTVFFAKTIPSRITIQPNYHVIDLYDSNLISTKYRG